MNIIEKKKKKPYSSKTTTTGDIQKNIDHFNKMLTGKAENTHTDGYLNGTFKSQSPDGASSISTGGESSGGDCGGGMGESLNINEAKRVVRRYLIRPQNIFCGSKFDIIKALIDIGNENCSVYTLNNLDDNNDTTKLTNKDIIYYYDDGVLYDKNKVKVMDYDLYVKREEKRDKIDVNKVSDATLDKVYKDRLTDQTELEEELSIGDKVICKVDNNRKGTIIKKVPNKDLYEVEFESTDNYPARRDTYYTQDLEKDIDLIEDYTYLSENNLDLVIDCARKLIPESVKKASVGAGSSYNDIGLNSILDRLSDNKSLNIDLIEPDYFSNSKYGRVFGRLVNILIKNNNLYCQWVDAHKDYRTANIEFDTKINETEISALLKRCANKSTSKQILKLISDAAKEANKLNKPSTKERRDTTARLTLTDEIANELQQHIVDIKFEVPSEDDDSLYNSANFEEKEEIQEKAIEKVRTLVDNFNNLPFANDAYENGLVEIREIGNERLAWIISSWGLVGKFTLDCDLSELSKEAQDWISSVKMLDKSKDNTERTIGRQVNCFRALVALINHFNNDVLFFNRKPGEDHELDLEFDDTNAFGESLREGREVNGTCCICGEDIIGYGNNPEPYMSAENGERCCDGCNLKFIIPARLEAMNRNED